MIYVLEWIGEAETWFYYHLEQVAIYNKIRKISPLCSRKSYT